MPFLPSPEKFDFSVPCGPEECKRLVESRLSLDNERRLVSDDLHLEIVVDNGSSSVFARAKRLLTPKVTFEFKGFPGATHIYCTVGVDQTAEPTMNKIAGIVLLPFFFYVFFEKSLTNYFWSDALKIAVFLCFGSFAVLCLFICFRAKASQSVDTKRYRALLSEITGELKSAK